MPNISKINLIIQNIIFFLVNVQKSTGAQGGPVCKICPLILTLDPYWGPQGGLK